MACVCLEFDADIDVRAVGSGAAGLAVLEAEGWRPPLILIDVVMPGMSGLETVAAMRRLPGHGATPVVFLTALAQPHDLARYETLGALGVISKPFAPMTFAQTVRGFLQHAGAAA